mmetsp:Transcript_14769/g.30097  ORF Transcript_14769/g.30097 Transcript_14769/m.30097 type:complete len:446 (+) Transcript_14769:641-1978(+)
MKWIEETEHRWTHHGGAGAYDTLRCDVQLPIHKDDDPNSSNNDNISNNKHHIKVWGQDFHLDRLERSYRSLLSSHMTNTDNQDNDNLETRLHQARTASYRILEALLEEAKTATIFHPSQQQPQPQSDDNYDSEDVTIQLIRVTWLWSPATSPSQPEDKPDNNNEDDDDKDDYTMIIVRGHAVCSTRPIRIHQPVTPIVCTLAVADRRHSNNNNNNHNSVATGSSSSSNVVDVDTTLPNRAVDPHAKIAAWTRQRQALERPHTYKPAGVSEVLLVRRQRTTTTTTNDNHDDDNNNNNPDPESIELLEGLSSNVFVVYRDGTLRTPAEGVLHGYVRHLVLECTATVGLRVDTTNPILLQDKEQWQEAFITSSSRLIYPISKILLVQRQPDDSTEIIHTPPSPVLEEFWHDERLVDTYSPSLTNDEPPKWQQLLDEILRQGGYPTGAE